MYTVTLSKKFQIGLPRTYCNDLGLNAGQKFVLVAKGDAIIMIPRREQSDLRDLFKGANAKKVRDRSERV